ncbi:hypothetical protein CTAYLR_004841 [Chrysophaeum taylorii]|uniref:Uncharacterized protein n=1 Tax=Chrysophaeum taylorii TaxID=2483200 RepID=A0AAD7XM12_9STRA|nr:hypothetical protein CTAYLR_004841 [Chrysophaeum taylorii]
MSFSKSINKRKASPEELEAEEARLASQLFGTGVVEEEKTNQEEVFVVDRGGVPPSPPEATNAWVDEDDFALEVKESRLKKLRSKNKERRIRGSDLEERLRARFQIGEAASWATKRAASSELQTLAASDESFAATFRLDVERVRDANARDPARAVIQALDWRGDVLLAAGFDKIIRLFRDGATVATAQTDIPVHAARFVEDTIIFSGRRAFFYKLDVETKRSSRFPVSLAHRDVKSLERFASRGPRLAFTASDGRVLLCDSRSGVWGGALRMNGSSRACDFVDDQTLLSAGGHADIYEWDLRTHRCVAKWQDPGASPTASIVAGDGALAVASESGVVNCYRGRTFAKALLNLTTTVDSVALDDRDRPTTLAYASKWAKDALRVVDLATLSVYHNWPTSATPLHYVHSLAFSPLQQNFRYLAIGNDRGRVLLYKIKQ